MQTAMTAGAAAGFALFLVQWMFVTPLIRQAEVYERQEESVAAPHDHDETQAVEGFQRVGYTAIGTVLTGIGFGAVLFGVTSLLGQKLDWRRGARLGVAGFLCVTVAPSLGLPPRPPGVPSPDVHAAQLWWMLTVTCTAAGLCLLIPRNRSRLARGGGVFAIALPHLLGAPSVNAAAVVPRELVWRFAAAAIGTQAMFWVILGALGGWLLARSQPDTEGIPTIV
jgi:cobalt transporter subunit CbtA